MKYDARVVTANQSSAPVPPWRQLWSRVLHATVIVSLFAVVLTLAAPAPSISAQEAEADVPADAPADVPADDAPPADVAPEDAPAADASAEDAPPADVPADDAPVDDVPADDAPVDDVPPVDDAPPADDAPVDDVPPVEDAPPAEDAPGDDAPAEDAPVEDAPPADDAPAEDAPVEDAPPAEDAPGDDAPAEDAPVEDAPPAEDAPVEDAPPVDDAPVEDAPPVDDAPVEDAPPVDEDVPPVEDAPPAEDAPVDDAPAEDGSVADPADELVDDDGEAFDEPEVVFSSAALVAVADAHPAITRVICGTDDDDVYREPADSGWVFYGGDGDDNLYGDGGDGYVFFGGDGFDVFDNAGSSGDGHVFFGGAGLDIFDNDSGLGDGHVFFGGADPDVFFNTDGSGGVTSAEDIYNDDAVTPAVGGLDDSDGPDVSCGQVCVSKVVVGGSLGADAFTVTTSIATGAAEFVDLAEPGYETAPGAAGVCYSFPPEATQVSVSEPVDAAYTTQIVCSQNGASLADSDAETTSGVFALTPTVRTNVYYGDTTTTPADIACVVTNRAKQVAPITQVICGTDGDDDVEPGAASGWVFYGGDGVDLIANGGGSGDGHVFFGGAGADVSLNGGASGDGHVFFGGAGADVFDNRGGSGVGHVFFGGAGGDVVDNFDGSGGVTSAENIDNTDAVTPVVDGLVPDGAGSDVSCGQVCVSKVVVGGSLGADAFTVTTSIATGATFVDLAEPAYVAATGAAPGVCYSFPPEATQVSVSEAVNDAYTTQIVCTQGAETLVDSDEEATSGVFALEPTVRTDVYYGDTTTTPADIACVVTNRAKQFAPIERVICGTDDRDEVDPRAESGWVFYGGDGDDYFNAGGLGDGYVFFGGAGSDIFFNIEGSGDGHVFFGGAGDDYFSNDSGSGVGYVFFGGAGGDSFVNESGSGGVTSAENIDNDDAVTPAVGGLDDSDGPDVSCGQVCVSKVVVGGSLGADAFTVTTSIATGAAEFVDLATDLEYETKPGAAGVCYSFPPEATQVSVSEPVNDAYTTQIVCTQGAETLVDSDAAATSGVFALEPTVRTDVYYGDTTTTPADIACVVTNTARTKAFNIKKTVLGAGTPSGDFTFSVVGTPDTCSQLNPTVAGGATVQVTVLEFAADGTACSYTVSETPSAQCAALTEPQTAVFDATVTFENACQAAGSLTIVKEWQGPATDTTFTVAGSDPSCTATPASVTIAAPAAGTTAQASIATIDVSTADGQPCTYTVTETVPPGYNVTPASGTAAGVLPNASVTFTNAAKPVTLTLTKNVTGAGAPGDWTLTATPAGGAAAVTIASGDGQPVPAGSYTLAESGPQGYTPGTWSCASTPPGAADAAPLTVSSAGVVVLAPGSTVSCEITNTQDPTDGMITIAKSWVGVDPGVAVQFKVDPGVQGCTASQTVTLAAGAASTTATVADIATGTAVACSYTVTETAVAGYTADALVVDGVVAGGTASFTNRQDPGTAQITIAKTVVGVQDVASTFAIVSLQPGCVADPATVTIDGTASMMVDVGDITNDNMATPCSYTVTETGTDPAGYTATDQSVLVVAGGTASFTNTQDSAIAQITIDKTVVGDQVVTSSFTIGSSQPGCTNTSATIDGTATLDVAVVDITNDGTATPCTYAIVETSTTPSGYTPDAVAQPAAPGDTVAFVNRQDPATATIVVGGTTNGPGATITISITSTQPGCVAMPASVEVAAGSDVEIVAADITNDGNATPCTYTVTQTGISPTVFTPDNPTQTITIGDGTSPRIEIANRQTSGFPDYVSTDGPFTVEHGAFDAEDPIECGGQFTGVITGSVANYTVSYALTGPRTIDLGSFTVAQAGAYRAPAGFIDYSVVPAGTYTVTFAVVSGSGRIADGSFDALITADCDDAGSIVNVAVPAAAGVEGPELAFTGRTTSWLAQLALLFVGFGALFAGVGRRRRNDEDANV